MGLIVIEGLDGSGKATQTELLHSAVQGSRQISFPVYDSEASAPVRMYLSGAFGSRPEDVNAYAASCFYAVDRYASYKTDWGPFYHSGGLLLADRYTTSNAIHQCAKLPEAEWDDYLAWLFDFEYRLLGIPEPDLVFYLRLDPKISESLMEKRYRGDAGKKDIHERDLAYQARSRAAADYCAEKLGWYTVECTVDGALRTPQDIHQELLKRLPPESYAE